jgi:hypothetical protein
MPMPVLLTVAGTGTSAIWQPDWMQNPFNISIGTIVTGGAGYQIECCLDNLDQRDSAGTLGTASFTAGNATFYPIATTVVFSANTTMNVQFPVTGLRVHVVTAGSAASTVSVNFIQATYGR